MHPTQKIKKIKKIKITTTKGKTHTHNNNKTTQNGPPPPPPPTKTIKITTTTTNRRKKHTSPATTKRSVKLITILYRFGLILFSFRFFKKIDSF